MCPSYYTCLYSNRTHQHCSEKEKREFKSMTRHLLKGQPNFICFSFFANILGKTIFLWLWIGVIVIGWDRCGGEAIKTSIWSNLLMLLNIILYQFYKFYSATVNKATWKAFVLYLDYWHHEEQIFKQCAFICKTLYGEA